MAKFGFDVAAAFAPQTGEGQANYDSVLDDITTSLLGQPGDPNDGNQDDGLILGDSGSGIGDSGLDFTVGRRRRVKAPVGSSDTRPIADFLAAEIPSFSFSFPFCGSRKTTTGGPDDADFVPLRGFEAILNGAGMVVSDWVSGVGQSIIFGTPDPFSALIYASGLRLELSDCRCSSLSIDFTPGSIAIATAQIVVGSIKDPSAVGFAVAALPSTLDYDVQATVSAPVVESVANTWKNSRGFTSLVLTITPNIIELPDSNATDGIIKEVDGRETTIALTLFADDTSSDEVYEVDQLFSTSDSQFDAVSFTVGTAAAQGEPALALTVSALKPEAIDVTPAKLGSKAGNTVNMVLGSGTANQELHLTLK